ncbi:MAG TPA: O-antigen ligase family protein, partial [Ignavibacteriaceae bacterium]|nr:O-antigen ligase family protein [Ignavibacteriaceae bacterium]
KKEWKYLVPLVLLIAVLFIFSRNSSEVKIFSIENNKMHLLSSYKTSGRAYDLTTSDRYYYVSDYEDGLLKYRDTTMIEKKEVPSPVVSLQKWNNYYLGNFIDTRFIVYNNDSTGNLREIAECLPPGFTISHAISGNFLYTLDMDSGLTIYENPTLLKSVYRNNFFSNFRSISADSDLILFFSPDSGLHFYKLINGLPGSKLYSFKPAFSVNSVFYLNHILYVSGNNGIKTYLVNEDSLQFVSDYKKPGKIFFWKETDNKIIAADQSGNIFAKNVDSPTEFKFLGKTDFVPASLTLKGDTLFTSYVKRSRLLSVWDPYLPANSVRLSLWKAGWRMFLDHPVFGVGDIDLGFLYKQYKSKYEKEIQGHMHNNFVHMLVIMGIFGFLAFCYLLFKLFEIDIKIYREMKNVPFASSYALGTIAALSTVIIAGLTEMNFFDHEIITLLWFTFGLNIAVRKGYKKNA